MVRCSLLLILTLCLSGCFIHKTEVFSESLKEKSAVSGKRAALEKVYLKALKKIADANTVEAIGPKILPSFILNKTGILEEKFQADPRDRFRFTLVAKLDMTVLEKAWSNNNSVKLLSTRPLLILKMRQGENSSVKTAIVRRFIKFSIEKGYAIKKEADVAREAYSIEFNLQEERVVDDLTNIILIVQAFKIEDGSVSKVSVLEKEYFRYTHLEIQKNEIEMKSGDLLSPSYLRKAFNSVDQGMQRMRYDVWLKGF